jgi:FkbM family methyltransferase
MSLYDKLYKWVEGKGIGNNIIVIHIKDFLDKPKLKEPIKVNGYLLLEGNKDVLGLLHHTTYEPETTELIKKYSKGIGLDLGANIGYFSLLMAQKCRKVYAFEPARYTFNLLNNNIHLNQSYSNQGHNIIAERLAVGNVNDLEFLSINSTDIGSNSFVSQGSREKEREVVKVIKLDDYFKNKPKVDIIKMDIEGYEMEAILGGMNVFKNAQVIIFENNLPLLKKRGMKGDEVPKLIEGMGFALKKLGNKTDDVEDYIAIRKVYKSVHRKNITTKSSNYTKR